MLIGVALSEDKRPMFDIETRVQMVQEAIKGMDGVKVEPFNSLLVHFSQQKNIRVIIRGLRAVSDFEYELQMGYANASLWDEIETLYLMPSLKRVHQLFCCAFSFKTWRRCQPSCSFFDSTLLKDRFKCM